MDWKEIILHFLTFPTCFPSKVEVRTNANDT